MASQRLIKVTERGLYCAAGDFYIDPWHPVPRSVNTHAHGDHFAHGCGAYLVAERGLRLFRARLGDDAVIDTLAYGEVVEINGVRVSLHPAGHILGSAQVRVEHRGEVWVFTGDYKTTPDPTCARFELVPCDTFITEATFGLPIYRWPAQAEVFEQINAWWRGNQRKGRASVLFGYALGKAQRLLAGVDASIGPIYTHGVVERLNEEYRASGVALPPTENATEAEGVDWTQALILAPPSARGTRWLRRFTPISTGFASGWMRVRGTRRIRAMDRGFVLSDHVDWPELMQTIEATGANRILATHGNVAPLVRWLREQGYDAEGLRTRYALEDEDAGTGED